MIAYKGFNKDLTCRGFKYEVGKTYETATAILYNSGFHACLDPLDCLYYYSPESSVYYVVDIQDVSQHRSNETTVICGKKITVLERMNFRDIYEHHKNFIESLKNNSTTELTNCKTVAKENNNIILGADFKCASAIRYNLVDFGDYNSFAFRDRNAIWLSSFNNISVEDNNAIKCDYKNVISVQSENIIEACDENTVSLHSSNFLIVNHNNNISGRKHNRVIIGHYNNISLDNFNNIIAKDNNLITVGCRNSISAGKHCFISADFDSIVKADKGSIITLLNFPNKISITKVVDNESIKSNTWYTLIDGEFTVATDEIIKEHGV